MPPAVEPNWTEPIARWHATGDSNAQYERLQRSGELLTRWPQLPFEQSPTDCFKVENELWIWQPGVGGIRCLADHPEFDAHPSREVAPAWFEQLVTRSWLPAMYPVWGRQVLHASAVFHVDSGDVIAFAGQSGAGKSTLAYGLASRNGWQLLCDDTLAFSGLDGTIALHPFKNESRLRPASAVHFGIAAHRPLPIVWPSRSLTLRHLYFAAGETRPAHNVTITPLKASESYPLLLEQAYALTLEIANHNQRLMRDYLLVAATVPASRLTYRRSFEAFEAVLDGIDAHAGAATDVAAARSLSAAAS